MTTTSSAGPLVPTMVRNHVVGLILMEDVHSGSRETDEYSPIG